MLQILKQIGTGVINGFPMVQSIIKSIKGVKGTLPIRLPAVEDDLITEKQPLKIISLITELIVVCLIVAFVFKKISLEDLQKLIEILKNK